MTTTTQIAVIAVILGAVVLCALALAIRRSRRRDEDRVTDAFAGVGLRMDEIATRLGTALDRVRLEGTRAQAVADLAYTGDLDEILARAVEATSLIDRVDAAIVRVDGPDGEPVVAATAVTADLAGAQTLCGPPDGRLARAVTLGYLYEDGSEPPGALRSGVAVPITGGGRALGYLAAYSFDLRLDDDAVVAPLEAVARATGSAVSAALRSPGALEAAPPVDSTTGLPSRAAFHDLLGREVARFHRGGQPLSVLLLDVDGFRALNAEIGQLAGDEVLRWIAAGVRGCLRDEDVACRVGGDELAVVLPDAGLAVAEGLFARVQATLLRQPLESAPSVTLSGGIAVAAPDDDGLTLYCRAEAALARAKATGRGTAAATP